MLEKELRKVIESNSYPPDFNKDKWRQVSENTNCYAYALNIYSKNQRILQLGQFSKWSFSECNSYGRLMKMFEADMKALGFKFKRVSCGENVRKGEIKIVLMFDDNFTQYHFAREDADEKWSHQNGIRGKVERILQPHHEKFTTNGIDLSNKWYFILKKRHGI